MDKKTAFEAWYFKEMGIEPTYERGSLSEEQFDVWRTAWDLSRKKALEDALLVAEHAESSRDIMDHLKDMKA